MSTDNVFSLPTTVSQNMSSANFKDATGIDDGQKPQAEEDDKSSSLSELGDRAVIEHSSHAASEANDTEAETERLEDSPQKQRRHQDVVFTSANGAYGDHLNQSIARILPETVVNPGQFSTENITLQRAHRASGPGSEGERHEQTSDISSLEDSGEESSKYVSRSFSSPTKRKRSSIEEDSASDRDTMREPSTKAIKLFDNNAAEASAKMDIEVASDILLADCEMQIIDDIATSPTKEEQSRMRQAQPKQKHKQGKRKGKRTPNDEPASAENAGSEAQSPVEHGGTAEAMYSNEEDAQMENTAEGVEAGNPVKMEERKRIQNPVLWKS